MLETEIDQRITVVFPKNIWGRNKKSAQITEVKSTIL